MKKTIFFIITSLLFSAFSFAENISIAINPGEYFKKRAPQIAVWIETSNGKFIDTLFVTKKAAQNKWIGSPKLGRPESLPDWYKSKGQNPAKEISKDELDATTSATPKKGIVINKKITLEKNTNYIIFCQVNQSFDYNNFWTKKNSGVDGQPAVLYSGNINSNEPEKEISLQLSNLQKEITTADKILDSVFVIIQ